MGRLLKHHTWEVKRIHREMEKPLDRDEIYEKYHVGARNPWLSWGVQVIHLAFDLSAFSLQIGLQVFS